MFALNSQSYRYILRHRMKVRNNYLEESRSWYTWSPECEPSYWSMQSVQLPVFFGPEPVMNPRLHLSMYQPSRPPERSIHRNPLYRLPLILQMPHHPIPYPSTLQRDQAPEPDLTDQ